MTSHDELSFLALINQSCSHFIPLHYQANIYAEIPDTKKPKMHHISFECCMI